MIFWAIAIPFLLNFLLRRYVTDSERAIGTEVDWLLFFGSYIGGVLSAIISFIALVKQSKENSYKNQLQRQQLYINTLETKLSEWISVLQFWELGEISLYLSDKKNIPFHAARMLAKLNEKYAKVVDDANAFELVYGGQNENQSCMQSFTTAYRQCIELYQEDVNEMTKKLFELQKGVPNENLDGVIEEIKEFNKEMNSRKNQYLQPVFDAAKGWIAAERNKEADLQNKLKRLGFDFD